ncbi:MAG: hypothetical protein ACLTSX_09050 [Collinsella sp.]
MELPGSAARALLVIGLPPLLLTLSSHPALHRLGRAILGSPRGLRARHSGPQHPRSNRACSYTPADDPLEHRQDSGYRVSGNITDEDGDIVASVPVETTNTAPPIAWSTTPT